MTRQPFEPEDLLRGERIVALDACDAHPHVVCAVQTVQDGEVASALWRLDLRGGSTADPPRCLTPGSAVDRQPRWSPDGHRIAFVSDRGTDGTAQVCLLPADGGEARRLTALDDGVQGFEWSPDGCRLAVTAPVAVDADWRGERARGREPAPAADRPQLAWRLPYKLDGSGFTLDQEIHLFVVDADSGQARQLTDGPFEVLSATWSPDGRRIAFARRREAADEAHASDIWVVDAEGGNAARRLTHEQPTAMQPAWSPDGRWIAFAGNVEDGDAQARLWLIEVESGEVRPLGSEDLEVQDTLRWLPDGSAIGCIVAREGRRRIATVTVPDGELACILNGDRQLSLLARAARHWVALAEAATDPGMLVACGLEGEAERRIDDFNAWWWDGRLALRQSPRRFTVPDGDGGSEEIQGWLVEAETAGDDADADSDADALPRPLLVDIHGGPASYAFLGWQYRPNWPVLATRGWRILALNPVGSSSFGRRFTERLRRRWGEVDLPQVEAAVQALQDEGLASERVAIAGKSYGGTLAAWALAHSARYRAAVICAPMADFVTHFGSSDSGFYADPYALGVSPFDDLGRADELSPLIHAQRVRTPTLLMQGREDQRCPVGQSEALFTVLRRGAQVPAELALYPGGDHHWYETGRPAHRVDFVRRMVDWLERWIDTPPLPPPAPAAAA